MNIIILLSICFLLRKVAVVCNGMMLLISNWSYAWSIRSMVTISYTLLWLNKKSITLRKWIYSNQMVTDISSPYSSIKLYGRLQIKVKLELLVYSNFATKPTVSINFWYSMSHKRGSHCLIWSEHRGKRFLFR